jgi:hypothetical protein
MATSTATTDALRDVVSGPVIGPDDPGYDEAREVFYGGIDRRPGAIARVATDDDIRRVVMIARKTGAELAVRAGGHSVAGHSASEGGIILDLRDLKQLDVHKDDRVAVAGPGLTAAEYTAAVGAEGLATGFGDTGSVGIGGITLGGGVGFLVRKHGLTIDSLLGADIVTADGELVTVARRPVLGDPRRRWQLRCRRTLALSVAPGGSDRRGHALPAGNARGGGRIHGGGRAGGRRSVDDRERDDGAAHAVHPRGAPRLVDRDGVPGLCGRRRRR